MKIRFLVLLLCCAMLLGGCGWMDGSYVSVTPHQAQSAINRTENLIVSNYDELLKTMEDVVAKGTESCVINAVNYDMAELDVNLRSAARYIQKMYPIGAYAVESIQYEVGSNTGKVAVALDITYRHGWMELRRIQTVRDMKNAAKNVGKALEAGESTLVLYLQEYEHADFAQIVQDHAREYPQNVMEVPQITSEVYGVGTSRVVELVFSYETSREAMRNMKDQVRPVFDSAVLYVSGEGTENQKFAQLYAFLMERFDYKVETSITPAYSLLRHGVGDSRAFATVYGAMCRASGLECMVITGTKSGEPWTWNLICENGTYYHVDLLRCSETGQFQKQLDWEMSGYVWDYSAFPEAVSVEIEN